MDIRAGITIERSKWLEELFKLRRRLCRYVRRYYGNEVYEALAKRFSGAADIVRNYGVRVSSVTIKGSSVVMVVVSTKGIEEGVERIVVERALSNGELVERRIGAPLEEAYHIVQVGPYGLKCTCTDALITTSKADKEFEHRLRGLIKRMEVPQPIFTKYVICKHTLAALSYALAAGVLKPNSKILNEILKLAIKALVMRVKGANALSNSTVLRMYKVLLRLSKGLPPS